ncbi:hypothetical protein AAMO2058_000254200 [Amorphochlora amoebiformis]
MQQLQLLMKGRKSFGSAPSSQTKAGRDLRPVWIDYCIASCGSQVCSFKLQKDLVRVGLPEARPNRNLLPF